MSRADVVAGLERLIERKNGFAAFHGWPHPMDLLTLIERRETRLMQAWLAGGTISAEEPLLGAGGFT